MKSSQCHPVGAVCCTFFLITVTAIIPNVDNNDAYLTTVQLIAKNGYPVEEHRVVTDDGYVLGLFRIPDRGHFGKPPILLAHGALGSSGDWILQGPTKALGYLLADNGYDVWLFNARGTRYSRNHTVYEAYGATRRDYWNFSPHEIGVYDLASTIDYILKATGHTRLIEIGHSQGGYILLVLLSERPEYNEKIIAHIGLAPASFFCFATSPVARSLAIPEIYGFYTDLTNALGNFNLGLESPLIRDVAQLFCRHPWPSYSVCLAYLHLIYDLSPEQVVPSLVPKIFGHLPTGGSSKQLNHYGQGFFDCEFRRYRTSVGDQPAKYNLKNVRVPIYAFFGENDSLVRPGDAIRLGGELPNGFAGSELLSNWGHMDFVLGRDARARVYDRTLRILQDLLNHR